MRPSSRTRKPRPASKPASKSAPRKSSRKRAAASGKTAPRKPAPRADFGAPIDGFFARQPPGHRAILDALRALVDEAAPGAESSLKWGMPFYTLGGKMFCALGSHEAHVNLIMAGPPSAFADPGGRLAGQGGGRHLKLTSLEELPRQQVRGWLRVAAEAARAKARSSRAAPTPPSRHAR